MAATTGATREVVCAMCGADVTERETRLFPPPPGAKETYWSRDNHRAACGLQCGAGGISSGTRDGKPGAILREGLFHGRMGKWIGKCGCG